MRRAMKNSIIADERRTSLPQARAKPGARKRLVRKRMLPRRQFDRLMRVNPY
jgi:hypothetical protein